MSSPRQQIRKDLSERIGSGEYPPGGRLPTRRELADQYHVHIGTIQHALDLLKADGLIEPVPGGREGALVLKRAEPQPDIKDLANRVERLERRVFGEET